MLTMWVNNSVDLPLSRVEQEVLSSKCNPQSIKLSLVEKCSSRTFKTVKQEEKQNWCSVTFSGWHVGLMVWKWPFEKVNGKATASAISEKLGLSLRTLFGLWGACRRCFEKLSVVDSLSTAEHAMPLITLLSPPFLFIKRMLSSLFSALITPVCFIPHFPKILLWEHCWGHKEESKGTADRRSRYSEQQNLPASPLCPNSLPSLDPYDNGHARWFWIFFLNSSAVIKLPTPYASFFRFIRLWIIKYLS